ncbi:MAG: molybdopterin molybdotransferase MoeA [Candidatus Aceula meridiana]|nr:molybdopterin molybdotransferase MoeA [Candidatus Aceula meridiana]
MISVPKAKNIILKNTILLEKEIVSFSKVSGRVLAEDIKFTVDWPPFSRSTMDGFAVRSKDLRTASAKKPAALNIVDISKAGTPAKKKLCVNQAIKIMTGAVIPQGADSVVMKEYTKEKNGKVFVLQRSLRGDNLRNKGADARKGQVAVLRGRKITPGVLAALASFGKTKIKVYQKPRVAILATGSELLKIHQKLKAGKIHSANEHALASLVEEAGGMPYILGIVKDNLKDLEKEIKKGLKYDIFLISGGVSVGDYDLVLPALNNLSIKKHFWRVAIKPGKPLFFGKKGKCHIFGLPGNTVSSMVSFYQFVCPCLLKMSGQRDPLLKTTKAILAHDIVVELKRHKVMRGVIFSKNNKKFVRLASHQISENVLSVAQANCLFEIKEGITRLKKGSLITAQYI